MPFKLLDGSKVFLTRRTPGLNACRGVFQASGNSFDGLVVGSGLVRRNTASGNGGSGISAGDSTVTENVATFNGRYGLEALFGIYGSNTFDRNGSGPVFNDTGAGGAVSQNNNGCNGIAC
jgi:hypothetical protein